MYIRSNAKMESTEVVYDFMTVLQRNVEDLRGAFPAAG